MANKSESDKASGRVRRSTSSQSDHYGKGDGLLATYHRLSVTDRCVRIVPLQNLIERLMVAQRRLLKVHEALQLYYVVVPDAVYVYQEIQDLCRNRYTHDLEQLDILVRLQRQVHESSGRCVAA